MGINARSSFEKRKDTQFDAESHNEREEINQHVMTENKKRIIEKFGKVAQLFYEQGIYHKEKVEEDLSKVEEQVVKFGERNESNASVVAERIVPEVFLQEAFSLSEEASLVTASDADIYDDQNNRIDSVIFLSSETDGLLPFGIDVTVSHRLPTIQKKIHLSSNDVFSQKPYGISKLEYLVIDDRAIEPFDVFRFCIAVDSNNISAGSNNLSVFVILSEMKEQIDLILHKNDKASSDQTKLSESSLLQLDNIKQFVSKNLDICIKLLLEENEKLLDFATDPDNKEYGNYYALVKDFVVDSGFDRAYKTFLNAVDSEEKNELVCMLHYSIKDGKTYLKDRRISSAKKVKKKYDGHSEELIAEPDGECVRIAPNDYRLLFDDSF